jgi:hypothetical protein
VSRRGEAARALRRLLAEEFGAGFEVRFDTTWHGRGWYVLWTDGPSRAAVRHRCHQVWGPLAGQPGLAAVEPRYLRQLSAAGWAVALLGAAERGKLPENLLALDAFGEDIVELVDHPQQAGLPELVGRARMLVGRLGHDPTAMWRVVRDCGDAVVSPTGARAGRDGSR